MLDKKILFEAWLRDSVFIEHSDGDLETLPREGIKERIEELINSGEYAKANLVAKQLSNPIKLTTSKKKKSVRVPFTTYIKLVDNALRQNISLNGYVSNLVKMSLTEIVSELKKREDVKQDRIRILESRLSDENKKSEDVYASRLSYSPFLAMPDNWKSIAMRVVEEARKKFMESHEDVNPEALQKWLEITYQDDLLPTDIDEAQPEIFLRNGKLTFTFGLKLFSHSPRQKDYSGGIDDKDIIMENFGEDAVKAIQKSVGDWAFKDLSYYPHLRDEAAKKGPQYNEPFLEAEIGITTDGKLTIVGIQVTEDDPELKGIRQHILKDYDDEIAEEKKELYTRLQNEDFDEVAKLSKALEELSNKREQANFAIDLIALLLKRTQVVTFSLPECLLYAWEAYGEHDLFKLVFEK